MRFTGILADRFFEDIDPLVQIGLRFHALVDRSNPCRDELPLLLFDLDLQGFETVVQRMFFKVLVANDESLGKPSVFKEALYFTPGVLCRIVGGADPVISAL